MPVDVIMPALGMSQDTGIVVRWLKQVGEPVEKGEPLLEIETDKAVVEVESPSAGRLASVLAVEGDSVPVGNAVALITAPGEQLPEQPAVRPPAGPPARQEADANAGATSSPPAPSTANAAPPPSAAADGDVSGTRLRPASPRARQRAAEQGVDIRTVQGTGPGGAVVANDVPAAPPATAPAAPSGSTRRAEGELSRTWRLMAERTTQSWTVPHFYLVREATADRLASWRSALAARGVVDVTYTDLLVKLTAVTVNAHPAVNRKSVDGSVVANERIGVGIAVAVEDGLVVPVIHDAESLSIREIAERRRDLAERARAHRLKPAELEGGSVTISNLGMYGVDAFTAILNAGEAAILSVGRIVERPVAKEGRVVVQPTLVVTLGCDHRVLDGARGAQFLQDLVGSIEEPALLLDRD